jgi:heme-degrading monooxygenase HmoA
MAVKILIKRKFKDGNMQAASRFLINTRTGAMKQPGYISSENLRSLDDRDEVVVVSMWETVEAWEAWKNSAERKAYVDEFKDYYVGEAQYEHYAPGLQLD